MNRMLKRLQSKQENGEKGLTIIEIVIFLAIAGILMSAAIVGYNAYQKAAHVNNLKSNVRDVATLIEAAHAQNGKYPTEAQLVAFGTGDATATTLATAADDLGIEESVTLTYTAPTGATARPALTGVSGMGESTVSWDFTKGALGAVTATP